MKVICAGYPKTGSKSCSAALRQLGYSVCDYLETMEFTSTTWAAYFNGEVDIDQVVACYDRHGFDSNQDLPGNFLWEELYRANPPGTKVIFTTKND